MRVLKCIIFVMTFFVPVSILCQESDNTAFILHRETCASYDSVCSIILRDLPDKAKSDMIFNIIIPEMEFGHVNKNESPQDLYSLFYMRGFDEKYDVCYRVVFCYNRFMDGHSISDVVLQKDSVVVDKKDRNSIGQNIEKLLRHEPFMKYHGSDFGDIKYVKLYDKVYSIDTFVYEYEKTFRKRVESGIEPFDNLISSVVKLFEPINIERKYHEPVDVSKSSDFPYINADIDTVYYQADFTSSYMDVVRTCKKFFRHKLSESEMKAKTDESYLFFNKLISAMKRKGLLLETDYDFRYIYYLYDGDLYSIVTLNGTRLRRTLVSILSDGDVVVNSDVEMELALNGKALDKDIKKLMFKVSQNTYCYSLDQPVSLVEIKHGAEMISCLIGYAYADICQIDWIKHLKSIDIMIGNFTDRNNVSVPLHPVLKRIMFTNRYKIVGYNIHTTDALIKYVDVNGY